MTNDCLFTWVVNSNYEFRIYFNKETNIKKEGDFIPTMELEEGNIGKRMKSLIPL